MKKTIDSFEKKKSLLKKMSDKHLYDLIKNEDTFEL